MGIIDIPTPPRAGRALRISNTDLKALAESVKDGRWVSDGEPTPTKTCAYQRAQTVIKLLGERFQLTNLKTTAYPADVSDPAKGYIWGVGPRPANERPRRKKTAEATA